MIETDNRIETKKLGHIMVLNIITPGTDGREGLFNNDADPKDLDAEPEGGDGNEGDGNGGDGGNGTGGNGGDGNGTGGDGNGTGGDGNQPQMTDEQKAIADKFKGTKFDEKGDLLDAEGKVVKTKAEIDEALKAEPKFDEQGNEVDEEGKVIRTAAQVEADNIAAENEAYFNETVSVFGIKPLNADGTEKVYPKTQEGLHQYFADVVSVSKNLGVQELFNALPDVAEYVKFRSLGGNPNDYFKAETDYSSVNVDALAEDQQFNMLVDLLQKTGMPKEQANKLAKYSKDSKELKNDLTAQLEVQKTKDAQAKADRDKALLEARQQQERETVQFWDGVKKQVTVDGKIGNFIIPVVDREAFFKYISANADGRGNSQANIDAGQRSQDLNFLIDYVYGFKKGKIEDLIKNLTGTVQVQNLKRMKTASTETGGGKKNPTPPITTGDGIINDREDLFKTQPVK